VRRLFRCINYLFVPRELAVADDWTPGVRATRRYRMQFIGSNDQNTAPWWPFSEHIGFAFFVTFSFSLLHVLRCTLNWLTANFERKHVFVSYRLIACHSVANSVSSTQLSHRKRTICNVM